MSQQSKILDTLVVVGVGLIGGSLAGALKTSGAVETIVGFGRNPENLETALDRGFVDSVTTDLAEAVSAADLVLLATPVGTLVELLNDARTLLLPADRDEIHNALSSLKVMKLLTGYRGRPMADIELILNCLEAISLMAQSLANSLSEMDINPLLITADRCVAADALIALFEPNSNKST